MKEKINIVLLLIIIGLLAVIPVSVGNLKTPNSLPDYDKWWSTTGSTGTVDEADISIYETNGPNINLKGSAPLPANLDVRYNIVAVDDLPASNYQEMTIRYKDNGDGGRVIIRLKETNMATGITNTRMTFDSNSFLQSSSYQKRVISNYGSWWGFDFVNNIYYLEASVNKTRSYGTPVLTGVQLSG